MFPRFKFLFFSFHPCPISVFSLYIHTLSLNPFGASLIVPFLVHNCICVSQMSEIKNELDTLPMRAMLAAAFITYLSAAPEDRRRHCLETWMAQSGLQSKLTEQTPASAYCFKQHENTQGTVQCVDKYATVYSVYHIYKASSRIV